jgi:dTDP-4-amino-4,6-dideoxygalactose transaminase
MNNKKIISSKEIKNVVKCMESNWISYTGKYVSKFEKNLKII